MLLPGLIDAHGHVMDLGFRAELDLSDTDSLAEAQATARRLCRRPSRPAMDHGRRLEPGDAGSSAASRPPPISIAAVRDRPVWLDRVDGHAVVPTRAAMQAAGITAATPRPPAAGSSATRPATRRRVRRCRARRWSSKRCRSRCRANATWRWPRRRRSAHAASPRRATWARRSTTGWRFAASAMAGAARADHQLRDGHR